MSKTNEIAAIAYLDLGDIRSAQIELMKSSPHYSDILRIMRAMYGRNKRIWATIEQLSLTTKLNASHVWYLVNILRKAGILQKNLRNQYYITKRTTRAEYSKSELVVYKILSEYGVCKTAKILTCSSYASTATENALKSLVERGDIFVVKRGEYSILK